MPENAESAGCHCSQGDSFVNNKWYERQNYSYVYVFHIFNALNPVQTECLTLSCETNGHSFKLN